VLAAQGKKAVETPDRKLKLHEILDALIREGLATDADAQSLYAKTNNTNLNIHPLVLVADQGWDLPGKPGRKLTLEYLTERLARLCNLPYYRVDPLKIDVARVTAVMSHAYAARFRILPVEVDEDVVVIATAEPFVREWVKELTHVLRSKVRRVIANPIEISRYLDEFYGLSRSIKEAVTEKGIESPVGINNLEQLVELGRSGRLDANDQHIVSIVDWLLQYAFEQRASDIHVEPRRDTGKIRFRIDGVLHLVYEMPAPVMAAVTSRIKTLGRMDVVERRRPQDGRV